LGNCEEWIEKKNTAREPESSHDNDYIICWKW
jgi:hypothetical protein